MASGCRGDNLPYLIYKHCDASITELVDETVPAKMEQQGGVIVWMHFWRTAHINADINTLIDTCVYVVSFTHLL